MFRVRHSFETLNTGNEQALQGYPLKTRDLLIKKTSLTFFFIFPPGRRLTSSCLDDDVCPEIVNQSITVTNNKTLITQDSVVRKLKV